MENNIPVSTVSSPKTQEEILKALRSQYSEEVIQIVLNQTLADTGRSRNDVSDN